MTAWAVPPLSSLTTPKDAFTVVSTFSGCGGSCLGYRMAGGDVLWANDFIDSACESYSLNTDSPIVNADIREVQADDILSAIGMGQGEIDMLDGSPPCTSFSMAGRREKGWGKVRPHSDGSKAQRSDDLFDEWLRILSGLRPRMFVAENVAGLARGKAVGYMKRVVERMRGEGYWVVTFVAKAQWLGVAQARERLFFVGVRNDVGSPGDLVVPVPAPPALSMESVLPHLEGHKVIFHGPGSWRHGDTMDVSKPSDTLMAKGIGGVRDGQCGTTAPLPTLAALTPAGPDDIGKNITDSLRRFTIPEIRRLASFPDDFKVAGTFAQRWERYGNCVPPLMTKAVVTPLLPVLAS